MLLVSVIVRTYNQEDLIADCLDSVLTQDYAPLQVVVSDDGSTDGTPAIVRDYARKYPDKITANYNRHNVGELKNFNVALNLCRGELVAFLDGDDVYYQNKISTQVRYFQEHEACAACYHNVAVFSRDVKSPDYFWSQRFETRPGAVKEVARYGHFPAVVSLMLRREHLPARGYNERLATQADWLLLMEALENSGGTLDYIDAVLAGYRVHHDNVSSNWAGKVESRYQTIQIAKEIYPHLARQLDTYFADLKFLDGVNCIMQRQLAEGIQYMLEAVAMAFPNVFSVLRIPLREVGFRAKRVFR